MTNEFYRGGSRSPFRTSWSEGAIAPQTARDYVALIAPGTAQDYRVKRVQVKVMVPKQGSPRGGWLAFLRVPDEGSLEISTIDIDAPSVLRPITFLPNPDHAVYAELFMEGINLAAGEVLGILAYTASSSGYACRWTAKWYAEAHLH